jgi:hypothetical protein
MFTFIIKYFGFLKFIPGLVIVFDCLLKVLTFITKPALLDWIDEIETEVLNWDGTFASMHKYGGLQLNYVGKEIGHIHGNGLLDMLLSRDLKNSLLKHNRIMEHHSFKNTGWISFYICTKDDAQYALELLKLSYKKMSTGNDLLITP